MSNPNICNETHIGRNVPFEQAAPFILARLMKKIDKQPNGCWIWTGYKTALGYGDVTVQGVSHAVHRLMCKLAGKPISDHLQGCHACDTPACCNPDHIFSGTAKDNCLDSKTKKRHFTSAKTHCARGHEYSIHGFLRADGKRACRLCDHDRRRREKTNGTGPTNSKKTHCVRGHELAGNNLYVKPNGERQCRVCRHAVIKRIAAERNLGAGGGKA